MAIYEKRYRRDGVPMPIQCLRMRQSAIRENGDQLHYHDYTELLFGLKGTASARVGNELIPLTAGSMIIVHNHELHDVNGTGSESEYIVVKFLPSILLTGDQTLSEYAYALLLMQNTHKGKIYFTPDELSGTPIPSLFARLMSEWDGERFGYELSLRADVTLIFLHIMRKWQEQNPDLAEQSVTPVQSRLLQNAITYIENNYSDVTEESCATALGVSPSYLSRVFKRGMRSSFSAYVNRLKLREAARLLATGDTSVTEIAETVGFSTVSYFISLFRAHHGVTPHKYRSRLTGE